MASSRAFGPICDAEAMSARGAGSLAVVALLIGVLGGCGGSDDVNPKRETASDVPVKTVTKGTCWTDELLPTALGAKGFDAWVAKYAGGDSTLGDAMRDDAAFTKEIDCSEPH